MPTNPTAPRENEIALVIRSPRAEQIANEIVRLETLGRYRLTPPRLHISRDVYFDTSDSALMARRLSLRIRILPEKKFITLKESLGCARVEIELAWSRAAFARIARELGARGIALTRVDAAYRRDDPVGTLKRAGLRVIQDRLTRRRARNVIGAGGRVCAELAIDQTTFFFDKRVAHLRQVEIEAKRARARIGEMARQLQALYAPALQPSHSKLAIGLAIQALLEQGALQKLLDDKNNLTPAALDRLARKLGGV